MISASAPGKVILYGEHAVVHGYTAAAIPLPGVRAVTTIVTRQYGLDTRIIAPMIDLNANVGDLADNHPLKFALQSFYTHFPQLDPPVLTISLESQIPLSSGMGSGAAVAASLLRSLFKFHGLECPPQTLSEMVYKVEKIHHGTPSGIDNTVVCLEKPIIFNKNQPIQTFNISGEAMLVIANCGHSTPTHQTVAAVRQKLVDQPALVKRLFTSIEQACQQGIQALQCSDFPTAGMSMRNNHASLAELGVSDLMLDTLVKAAVGAGAWGAKLSGGGRGGIVIALCPPEKTRSVCAAFEDAGGSQIITTPIATDGQPDL